MSRVGGGKVAFRSRESSVPYRCFGGEKAAIETNPREWRLKRPNRHFRILCCLYFPSMDFANEFRLDLAEL